jgi:hypothetical protein
MKQLVLAAIFAAATAMPAVAQSSTAIGTGIATAKSTSAAQAVAISGQGGAGGQGGTASQTTNINTGNPPVQTINSITSGTQNLRNVPTVFAPGLTAAGIESCLGSVSGGAGWLGTGITLGGTVPDPSCAARLDARTLWSFGLKKAAVARLCLSADIYRAMPEVCYQYLPQQGGYFGAAYASTEPANVVLSTSASQSIELIDGKTGAVRMCDHYDAKKFKCWHWHNDPHNRIAAHKRVPKVIGGGNPVVVNEQHQPAADAVNSKDGDVK